MITVTKPTHHVEALGHQWIRPLLGESQGTAGEPGDENDSGHVGVAGGLCPDPDAIRSGNIDGKGGSGERECREKWSKLHDDSDLLEWGARVDEKLLGHPIRVDFTCL
jgi:hypothetical protein